MASVSEHHPEFERRLRRIAERSASRTQMVFVGEDEVYRLPIRERGARRAKARGPGLLRPLSQVFALALGLGGEALGRLAQFQIAGLAPWAKNPDVEMAVQLIIGTTAALVLGQMLRLKIPGFGLLAAIGAAAGVVALHDAVHQWPEIFIPLTSKAWVAHVLATTKAQSILWRGVSIAL